MRCWNRGSSVWVPSKRKCCNETAAWSGTITIGWPTITGMSIMKNDAAVFACALMLACALSNRTLAQTPEQEKLWEAQRVQRAAEDKAKADLLLRQRAARKADPMAWVRTLHPMTEGGWVFRS